METPDALIALLRERGDKDAGYRMVAPGVYVDGGGVGSVRLFRHIQRGDGSLIFLARDYPACIEMFEIERW